MKQAKLRLYYVSAHRVIRKRATVRHEVKDCPALSEGVCSVSFDRRSPLYRQTRPCKRCVGVK